MHPLFGDRLQCAEFPEWETAVYGLSFHKREIKENVYEKAKPWKKQRCEILLAHGGDEKHVPLNKAGLLALGYDYVALGHIHKPGIIEENRILYAGRWNPLTRMIPVCTDMYMESGTMGNLPQSLCRLHLGSMCIWSFR